MKFILTPKTNREWLDLVAKKDAEIARLRKIIKDLAPSVVFSAEEGKPKQ